MISSMHGLNDGNWVGSGQWNVHYALGQMSVRTQIFFSISIEMQTIDGVE